jgi:hypothetical protein
MNQFYVKNSGSFITQNDFKKFDAWCEWYDSEEIEYIKCKLESPESFQKLFLKPNEKGIDCYYPLPEETSLPYREFMYVACSVVILGSLELFGYVSLVCNEITSITLWVNDKEIVLLRSDRLAADEDNPENISFIRKYFGVSHFNQLYFETNYKDSSGSSIVGKLLLTET